MPQDEQSGFNIKPCDAGALILLYDAHPPGNITIFPRVKMKIHFKYLKKIFAHSNVLNIPRVNNPLRPDYGSVP